MVPVSLNTIKVIDNYNLFFQFGEYYLPSGFKEIDRMNPILLQIEEMTKANDQFFFVGDLIQMKILFTSRRSVEMMGIESENVDPGVFFTSTHPDDILRHNIARTKLINLGQQLYIERKGSMILSTNFRFKHPLKGYTNTLVQCYLFYTDVPYETVFLLQVLTDISWFRKMKHGYHYFIGNDMSLFRYPDEVLLLMGHNFTKQEFLILELLGLGFSTEQIATKLFLSIHTINSHRRNILKKTGKATTHELILDLKARGML